MTLKVVEKFISINGEGNLAGHLAVFIRFAGCNLKCAYCDTGWANDKKAEYLHMTADDIYKYIKSTGIRNVTLTGGEPLLQEGIYCLLFVLSADPLLRVEVETNGSVDIRGAAEICSNRPVFTIDYKLPSSGMEQAMLTGNFKYLERADVVKFVAGSSRDLERAGDIIGRYGLKNKCCIHLSPVFGKLDMKVIVDFLKRNGLDDIRLQPQLHKIIWHPDTIGV